MKRLFDSLTWKQILSIVLVAGGVIAGLVSLSRWNQERDFRALYSSLSAEDAAAVLAKVRESGTEFRISDSGTSVLVPSAKVAELRLQLAAAGIPKSGRIGYELFDKTNFGASDFAEQVNYHRALEGELERSVMSIREVAVARVHITAAKDSLYTEQRQPAKASVLVQLRRASALSPQNIQAICQLLASAVPGLAPELVTVVDTNGNLLNRARPQGSDSSEATLDYRKSIEKDIQNKIAATLEPLLGIDHFRAGVSADVDLTSGDQNEETYDPQKSAITNSQKTDDGAGVPGASGIPGTASNLPRPTAASPTPPTSPAIEPASRTRHTENISYQPSRVIKHIRLPQGAVTRLSLSVLVDHTVRWVGEKKLVEPPSADKLKVIKELVTAATGLDAMRGDQLVVDAFPFEATLAAEPPGKLLAAAPAPVIVPSLLETLMAYPRFKLLAGIGLGVLLLAVVGLVILRRKSAAKRKAAAAAAVKMTAAIHAGSPAELPPTKEEIEQQIQDRLDKQAADFARKEAEALMQLQMPEAQTKKSGVLTKHLIAEAKKDPAAMAQVVRAWLDGDKPKY